MKQAMAYIEFELNVDCPYCDKEVDLVEVQSDGGDNSINARVFMNKWDELKGWPIECPHCHMDFELAGLEY